MKYITLNNGVKMPILGYGVFQVTPENAKDVCLTLLKQDIGQ